MCHQKNLQSEKQRLWSSKAEFIGEAISAKRNAEETAFKDCAGQPHLIGMGWKTEDSPLFGSPGFMVEKPYDVQILNFSSTERLAASVYQLCV